ncbi:MAG TPA: DUF805 domain-containing protein [Anaeromyxobacteraceae bacterium]|nr:DUF805 domain-containing protein [Anaeromyxobacteraceae bacterium]
MLKLVGTGNSFHYYVKALLNYANFNGRARRSEFWYFALFNVLITMGVAILGLVTRLDALPSLYCLAVIVPGIAAAVRRMHDVGKSGWYVLIPIYNLILGFTEGERGTNRYGLDPKKEVNRQAAETAGRG